MAERYPTLGLVPREESSFVLSWLIGSDLHFSELSWPQTRRDERSEAVGPVTADVG